MGVRWIRQVGIGIPAVMSLPPELKMSKVYLNVRGGCRSARAMQIRGEGNLLDLPRVELRNDMEGRR
ncbi:MAG: hypothetical protein KGH94_05460 [Candidatus Micrarchaeota archaeon]|nr:hypothetical protein [Candidatus Micrarchaeota archaeon]